jgi:bifunctional non-homologous end joining protein LigD
LDKAGDTGPVHFADHLQGQGETFYEQACELKLEGIISKRADRPHRAGRGREWLKIRLFRKISG